ncbi:MAG TPA: ABC transporter ATP-binding protein [Gammaproteobacteria bacterium]|jgi:iron complex transport system ATP-binding protein
MSLRCDALTVRYRDRVAVRPSSIALARGTVVALVGPNGAGKSSLLKAIAGLVPCTGTVQAGEQALSTSPRSRARTIAYLPQSPAAHWPMKVRDLVALGRLPHRAFGSALRPEDAAAIDAAMRETGVTALAERAVDELSGGELSRVQLARALAVRAPILLVDEPVAALDPYHQLEIMHVLTDYAARDALVVAVLHDLTLAARFAHRVIVMHEGEVVADGRPEQVLSAETLRRYYHVEPFLSHVAGQPLVVPWRTLQ